MRFSAPQTGPKWPISQFSFPSFPIFSPPFGSEENGMKPEQLQACTERLPPDAAREFERLQREATALLEAGWRLRREAWALYQSHRRRL
jgi:hypothetical protein